MKNILTYLFILVLLTSCSFGLNAPRTRVDIHTTHPATILIGKDTFHTSNNNLSVMVERREAPFEFSSLADSTLKTYRIQSFLSSKYWGNIFFLYGIGYLLDLQTPKRFAFPQHIYINPYTPDTRYKTIGNYNHKGELYLNFSIPELNFIQQHSYFMGTRNQVGFLGISAGMDYYYKPSTFANITGSIATTFPVPVPVPIDYEPFGPSESGYTEHISISNNHTFYFLSVGYGLSFSQYVWNYYHYDFSELLLRDMSSYYEIHKKSYALGFVFPVYLKLGRNFNLGLIYRPTFYRPVDVLPFKYEHLISVDLAWKFRVSK